MSREQKDRTVGRVSKRTANNQVSARVRIPSVVEVGSAKLPAALEIVGRDIIEEKEVLHQTCLSSGLPNCPLIAWRGLCTSANLSASQRLRLSNRLVSVTVRIGDNCATLVVRGRLLPIMAKIQAYRRTSALPAIAAALALSSTPLLAQQSQPQGADSPPAPAATQPIVPDIAPSATETATLAPSTSDTASSSSSGTTSTSSSTTALAKAPRKAVKRPVRVAAAKPAAVSRHTQTQTETSKTSVPAATSAKVTAQSTAVSPQASTASQSAVKPVVDMKTTKMQSTTTANAHPATKHDKTVPIAAGGVLALLAIGGTAAAMTRRRSEDEEEWADEETMEGGYAEPASVEQAGGAIIHEEQPAIVAPATSAFAWRSGDTPAEGRLNRDSNDEDRRPGETWIERAYRGPSPANPSASLRTRLKRAAFFDKRERDAAAGLAEPVETTAGLPDAMIEGRGRELT